MFQEIQLRISQLLKLFAQQAQLRPIDFGDVVIPAGSIPSIPASSGPLVVDHIEFPAIPDPTAIPGGVVRTVDGSDRIFHFSAFAGGSGGGLGGDVLLIEGSRAKRTQLAVPVTIWVAPQNELGTDPAPDTTALPYVLIWIDILAGASGSLPGVTFSIVDVGDVSGALATLPAVKAKILARFATVKLSPIQLDLSPLKDLGLDLPLVYGDVALTAGYEALAFRMEIPTAGSVYASAGADYGAAQLDKWLAFYDGTTESLLATGIDWAYSIEGQILEYYFPDVVKANLHPKDPKDPTKKKIDWTKYKTGIEYLTDGPTITFTSPSTANLHLGLDLSPCSGLLGEYVWPHVDLNVTTTYAVEPRGTPPVGTLVSTTDVSRDVSNTTECEIAAGLFVGLSEAVIMSFGGFVGIAVGFIFGAFGTIYLAADAIASASSGLSDKYCKQKKWSSLTSPGEEYECAYPFVGDQYAPSDKTPDGKPKPGAKPLFHLTLAAMLDRPGTFSIGGGLSVGDLVDVAVLELTVDPDPFTPTVENLCGSDPTASYSAFVSVKNTAKAPSLPLYLLDVSIHPTDDPANQYAPYLKISTPAPSGGPEPAVPLLFPMNGDGKRISIRIPIADINDDFVKAPYDCIVSVRSTGGVRRVRLAGIKPMTDAEKAAWAEKIKLLAEAECPKLVQPIWTVGSLRDHWWDGGDPPAPDGDGVRIWEYGIGGLAPDEIVTVVDDRGTPLATGIATHAGFAFLSALTSTLGQGRSVELRREVGGWNMQGGAGDGRQVLAVRKTLLVRRATLNLDRFCVTTAAAFPLVLTLTSSIARVFDVSVPLAPILRASRALSSGVGACRWRKDAFLIWGEDGAHEFDAQTGNVRRVLECSVASAAALAKPDALYLATLRNGVIELFVSHAPNMDSIQSVEASDVRELAFIGDTLVARTPTGFDVFSMDDQRQLTKQSSFNEANGVRMFKPELVTRRPSIALQTTSGTVIVDLADPQSPRELMRTPSRAWFADVARTRNLLAHIDHNGSSVTIYESEAVVDEIRSVSPLRSRKACNCP